MMQLFLKLFPAIITFSIVFVCISTISGYAQEHPFLLINSNDYSELRERAQYSPWNEMKTEALRIANDVDYDAEISGPRNKSSRFVEIVSSGTLAYILDPSNSDLYLEKIISTLYQLDDIHESRTGGDWNSNVPVANSLFNSVLALDILHNELSEDIRNDIEQLISKILPSLSDNWDTSPLAAKGIWALYKNDRDKINLYKKLYREVIEVYLTDDGLFSGGTNYGHSRFAKPEREQKFMFMDVLAFTGEDDWYNDPKAQALYEWLYGQTLTVDPANSALTFGDSRLFSSHYRRLNESPRTYSAHRFSELAGQWAAWHVKNQSPSPRLTTYITADRVPEPKRPQFNQIYPVSGAWFFHQPDEGPVFGGALWNTNKSESHTHKETNAIHLTAYGEHVMVNAGYNGWGNGGLGFSWEYINNTAISGNTLVIDNEDHLYKHGNGIIEGFTAEKINYASGHSGMALPNGVHVRNFIFIPPSESTNGYWILFDEVEASKPNSIAQVVLHPHSDDVTTITNLEAYQWLLNRTTGLDAFVTVYLATPPETVNMRDGLIADGSSQSFLGKAINSYYQSNEIGKKNIVTVIYPSTAGHELADLERITGSGFSGAKAIHGSNNIDLMLESSMDEPVSWKNITFEGSALWMRETELSDYVHYFIRKGTSYWNGNLEFGFESEKPVSFYFYGTSGCEEDIGKEGKIISPGTNITLHQSCVDKIHLNDQLISVHNINLESVEFYVPPGTHTITMTKKASTQTQEASTLPVNFKLHGNYPNPFNPGTTIHFDLPHASEVKVNLYDMLGRKVKSTPTYYFEAGTNQQIKINANDLPSGVYIYRIFAGNQVMTSRMVFVK